MSLRVLKCIVVRLAPALALVCSPVGAAQTCVSGLNVRVCVDWSRPSDPELTANFNVSFSNPTNPTIELITGDSGWIIYAETLTTPPEPANIGSITIDPTVSTDDFVVTNAKPGVGSGANDVGSIVLFDSGWSGYSSVGTGSYIAGNLSGDLVVAADSSGNGGELSLQVDGNLLGSVTAARLTLLRVTGSVDDASSITATHFQKLHV